MALKTLRPTRLPVPETSQPPALPLVYVGQMAPLISFLGEIGAPVAKLLRESRIPVELFEDPDALVPLGLVHRLLENASRSDGIGNLGVLVGLRTAAFDLPVLGSELRQAITVYDYLQRGIRLIGRVQPGERFWLTLESDQVRFHQSLPGRLSAGRHQADLYTLVVTIGMLRRFAGDGWVPQEISLSATDRRFIGDCHVFGDAKIRLGQSHSSFTIPNELLLRPIRSAVGATGSAPEAKGLTNRSMPQGFVASIETLAVELLKAQACRIDTLAEAAGLTTRTLQRRLSDNGLSYSALVAETRRRLAADWLSRTELSVREIAMTLGYTDPANFTRAFRRTTGTSPRQYRLECRQSAGTPAHASAQRPACVH